MPGRFLFQNGPFLSVARSVVRLSLPACWPPVRRGASIGQRPSSYQEARALFSESKASLFVGGGLVLYVFSFHYGRCCFFSVARLFLPLSLSLLPVSLLRTHSVNCFSPFIFVFFPTYSLRCRVDVIVSHLRFLSSSLKALVFRFSFCRSCFAVLESCAPMLLLVVRRDARFTASVCVWSGAELLF